MESIWFFDFCFTPLFIIHDYFSVNWELYLNEVGRFELHGALSEEIVTLLQKHRHIVAVQGEKQAIITGWQMQEEYILYGRTCNWILSRRVTPAYEMVTNTPELMSRQLVSEAFKDVPEMKLGDLYNAGEEASFELSRDATTLEAVQACLEDVHAGHKVVFDVKNKCWIFLNVFGGKRSVILSEDNRNISESVYTEEGLDHYSGIWYYLELPTDEEGNKPESVRTYLDRGENLQGIFRWEGLSDAKTESEAEADLKKKQWHKQATAKMRSLTLGKDYEIGDFIVLQVTKGGFFMEEEKQIVGVHIWYEADSCGEEPIFK